ncbi:MAG: aminoacyl-tRNA hydrolase [Gammaproteobacteria bacterium]|nr:aminoacyl-tRNA hydrolase [Gammaproteobacteria bacterium]
MAIQLIVGLGNPGDAYKDTRHNLGANCLRALLRRHGLEAAHAARYKSDFVRAPIYGQARRCLIPLTYMNLSGQPVGRVCRFFRIPAEDVLVIHDETAFAPGVARLKDGGGAGGHNGVRDVIRVIGPGFKRLRLGVGQPPKGSNAVPWLVNYRPPQEERELLLASCEISDAVWAPLLNDDMEAAMNILHAPSSDD